MATDAEVEVVARAIYEAQRPNHHASWGRLPKEEQLSRHTEARAAIAALDALREPKRDLPVLPLISACDNCARKVTIMADAVEATGAPKDSGKGKGVYIGAPACFALEQACQHVRAAFGSFGIYQVGSSLERQDWRDVDLRYILPDDEFAGLFPDAGDHWEQDPRWLLLTVAISDWLSKHSGLPVDFQFQPQTHANARHKGRRNAIGLRFAKTTDPSPSVTGTNTTGT